MATIAPPKPAPAAKYDAELAAQIDQAARRIRAADVMAGVLLTAAVALGYVAAMIALDRWLDLPAWCRQLGFVGLVAALGVVGYRAVVRPLRRAVNPLYAAKQVEGTVADAKNGIVNYVDLRDEDLPESVKAAVGAKAAAQVRQADLAEAVDSRRLVRTGLATGLLVVVLAVLFLVFRPSQFFSLVGRTLTPFSSGAIATRTEITVTDPAGGDTTVTAGQPVLIAVTVGGKIPDPAGPAPLRVRLRHNPADPNFEDVLLEPTPSNRDWQVRIPDHLVQNGFWYTVSGGDAATPEYKVTVRSRPRFTAFEARYEYPAYLRLQPETAKEPQLEAYRGTTVELTATANRELKSARLHVAGQPAPLPGEVVGEKRDSARFRLTLAESGSYRLAFTAVTGEESVEAPAYPIKVLVDQPPSVNVTSPELEETSAPANGRLAVDALIGDDFGIDTVTLKLKVLDAGGKALAPRPYMGGKSFRREADGTFPTSLEYKDSVALSELKDEAGGPARLAEGLTLEYWLEATDNCTVPAANVGRSKPKRVKLTAAVVDPPKPDADARKQAEEKHQKAQKKKLEGEQRQPPQQPRPDAAEKKTPEATPEKSTDPMKGGDPTKGDPMKGGGDPMPAAGGAEPSHQPMGGGEKPPTPDVKKEADRVQQELDKQNNQPGDARGADDPRPQPGEQPPAEKKPEAGKNDAPPAEPKGSQPGADNKPDGGASEDKKPGDKGGQPGAEKPMKPEEAGGEKGEGKPNPNAAGKGATPPNPAEKKAPPQPNAGGETGTETKPAADQGGEPAAGKPAGGGAKGSKPDQKKVEQALNDLQSGDPQREQAGREELDKQVGQPGREKAEQLAKEAKKGGEAGKDAAQKLDRAKKDPEKLSREDVKPDRNGDKDEDVERLFRDAQNLNSPDEAKRREAEQNLDKAVGKDARDQLQKKMKDAQPGDGGKAGAEAKRDIEELTKKKPKPQTGGGEPEKGTAKDSEPKAGERQKGGGGADEKKMQEAVKNLASGDPQKQQQAREELDKTVGPEARKEAERLMNDLKSDDPKTKVAAEKKLNDLNQQAGGGGKPEQPKELTPEQKKELTEAAKDLTSDDPKKREAAQQKLDKAMGKDAREQAEQMAKDLKSDDAGKRAAAERKLEELQKQAAGGQPGAKEPTPEQRKDVADAAKDLGSPDPKKQQNARDKLDKAVGKDARQKMEEAAKDLKSDDADKRSAAEKKIDDLAKQAAGGKPDGQKKPTPEQMKEMANAAKDLASDDPKKQQAARDKLDKMMGKDAREQAEQMAKDLKSDDPAKKAAAEKKLNDLAKQAQAGGDQGMKEMTPEEKKQLADIAKDLASKDAAKQQEAAEKLADSKLGKDLAEGMKKQADQAQNPEKALEAAKNLADLQNQMKDLASGDPKKAEEAAKNLKDLADRMKGPPGKGGEKDPVGRGAGADATKDVKDPLKGTDAFGKLPGEMQLETFKKQKDNKELLKKLGYTDGDYERFLKGFEEAVKEERAEFDRQAKKDGVPQPIVPKVNVGEATGKVERRGDGTTSDAQGAGAAAAPPGFGEARKKFTERAGKSDKK